MKYHGSHWICKYYLKFFVNDFIFIGGYYHDWVSLKLVYALKFETKLTKFHRQRTVKFVTSSVLFLKYNNICYLSKSISINGKGKYWNQENFFLYSYVELNVVIALNCTYPTKKYNMTVRKDFGDLMKFTDPYGSRALDVARIRYSYKSLD